MRYAAGAPGRNSVRESDNRSSEGETYFFDWEYFSMDFISLARVACVYLYVLTRVYT